MDNLWNHVLGAGVNLLFIGGAVVLAGLFFKLPKAWAQLEPILEGWQEVKDDVLKIKTFLQTKFPRSTLFQAKSPISLTDVGKEIATNINSASIVSKHVDSIKIREEANAYNIQEVCFHFADEELFNLLQKEERDKIETEAFKRGLEVTDVLRVIGVLLRDKVLDKKGYQPKHVDAHDPQRK